MPEKFRAGDFLLFSSGLAGFVPFLFGFVRGAVPQRLMQPFLVVTERDVTCSIGPGSLARRVHHAICPLDSERGVERLRPRIIVTNAGPAHRTGYLGVGGETAEVLDVYRAQCRLVG